MENFKEFINRTADAWGINDVQTFELLNHQSHQKALRLNTLKSKKVTIKEIIDLGIKLKPIKWAANCYYVESGYEKLTKTSQFNNGEFILQDSASFIPVLAIGAQPGQRILDICAAPGGKTSHLASITNNKATIVANDSSKTRFFKMRWLLESLNVKADMTIYDGRTIFKQFEKNSFDSILLDAPCSGEANINPEKPDTYKDWTYAKIKRLNRLQEQLILSAYTLLKPCGILVYSTCTIAPEENEQVINYLLKKRTAKLLPIDIDLEANINGLTKWRDKQFEAQMTKAVRLIPSKTNEAFFVAKIQKPLNEKEDEYKYFG